MHDADRGASQGLPSQPFCSAVKPRTTTVALYGICDREVISARIAYELADDIGKHNADNGVGEGD